MISLRQLRIPYQIKKLMNKATKIHYTNKLNTTDNEYAVLVFILIKHLGNSIQLVLNMNSLLSV